MLHGSSLYEPSPNFPDDFGAVLPARAASAIFDSPPFGAPSAPVPMSINMPIRATPGITFIESSLHFAGATKPAFPGLICAQPSNKHNHLRQLQVSISLQAIELGLNRSIAPLCSLSRMNRNPTVAPGVHPHNVMVMLRQRTRLMMVLGKDTGCGSYRLLICSQVGGSRFRGKQLLPTRP